MKKFRRVLLFLLLVPICFGFSACKKNNDADNSGNTPPTEQNPGDNTTPTASTYTVNFDYNLPEDYDFLLTDYQLTKEVGTSTNLVSPSSAKLSEFFEGWLKNGEGETLTGSVSGSAGEVINLKGKWNEENLRKFYYSDGLSFDLSEMGYSAKVISYTGSSSTVILPKYFNDGVYNYEVNKIGDSVFENNKNINKLIINGDGLSIGNSAFKNTNISTFDFNKVTQIGEYAFENTKLTSVTLNSNVSFLGTGAFKNCINLVSFDFNGADLEYEIINPYSLETIKRTGVSEEAFSGCSLLKTLSNTSNLKGIGYSAFSGCTSLENTDFLGNKVVSINGNAFLNCTGLTSVNLPESITSINDDEGIFVGCENISELKIGYIYLKRSSNGVFNDSLINHLWGKDTETVGSVTKIVITGNSVTKLYEYYFTGFVNLTDFEMSNSITEIEDYTFSGCSKLENIVFSNSIDVSSFSSDALNGTKYLKDLNKPWILNETILFYVPKTLSDEYKNYVVPNGVTTINANVFANNETLETLKIPSSVTSIGVGAFSYCRNLTSVEFETNPNLTSFSEGLFYSCINLATIIGLDKLSALSSIMCESFAYTKISTFTIPSTVSLIEESAFAGSKISKFVMLGSNKNYSVEDGVLYETKNSQKVLLLYPSAKTDAFFFCPEDVDKFGANAFYNVENLIICFKSNSITWGTSTSQGEPYVNVFNKKLSFICLGEKIEYPSISMDYYTKISDGSASYDLTNKTIKLTDFTGDEGLYYIGFADDTNNNKISIAAFEIEKVTVDSVETLQVKENTLKILKTDLTSI